MKTKNSRLITAYSHVFEGGRVLPTCESVREYIQLLKKTDISYPVNNTFIIITNAQTQSYEFISKNFKAVTGIAPETVMQKGVKDFLARMHPDDVEVWLELMMELMEFVVSNIALKNRKRIDVQYNFRFKTSDGSYINLLENQVILQIDEEGKPQVGMGHYTVFGNEEFNPIIGTVRVLNHQDKYETVFTKNFSKSKILSKLTTREQEIIELLLQKKTSKEVAEQLFVSSHTIDTHRRNIIKKLNLKSTQALENIFETNHKVLPGVF